MNLTEILGGLRQERQEGARGHYNVQLMLSTVLLKGEVGLCGTCIDARGMRDDEVIEGARRSTLGLAVLQLA